MKMTSEQHDALWELLNGPVADEATSAAQVYPPAVLGPAVSPPTIMRRVWPGSETGDEEEVRKRKRKRKRKKIPMEAIFPRFMAR